MTENEITMNQEQASPSENTPNPSEFKAAFVGIIETTLNEYINMDAQATAKLVHLSGKTIAIELQGWDITLFLLPDTQGIQVMTEYVGQADTVIRGTPIALFNMSQGETSAATLREQNITIDGDLELGQQFSQFFKQLDIDWQEKIAQSLSKITTESNADVVAHKAGRLFESFMQWTPQAKQTLEENLVEYFQVESQILPLAEEMEPFSKAVDTLRNDVDRLEAKMARFITSRESSKT